MGKHWVATHRNAIEKASIALALGNDGEAVEEEAEVSPQASYHAGGGGCWCSGGGSDPCGQKRRIERTDREHCLPGGPSGFPTRGSGCL